MRSMAAWLVGIGLLTAATAHATVMERLEPARLAATASEVVEGKVVGQRVVLLRGDPWTETKVRVTRLHKGQVQVGQLLTIRQPGGETKTVGMRVAGSARFTDGERVFLFARPVGDKHVPVGMCQGKFGIYRDAAGTWRARRDLSDVAFAERDRAGKLVIAPQAALVGAADATLSELRKVVEATLAARRGGAR